MSASDRLKKVRELLGKGQKEMAETMGINYRTYQNYENALSDPSWSACESLAKLGFNANWLLTGEGEIRRGAVADRVASTGTTIVSEPHTGGFAPQLSAEVAELAVLLENYGNKALKADLKVKLIKIKDMVEG